ncbi:MAG: YbaB/EbfC family nucleoid-associated protein [Rhabdochlamydiaceae bacterium]|nr:YbaB/EbfC family nucleoid-associated protein [Rhabdochlamydiaceae bacterium]
MGSGFAKMKKQAKQFEEQMKQMQEVLKSKLVTGQSGNGLVAITLDGEKTLQKISIKPECVDPQDIEGLEDLILAAYQDALRQVQADAPSFEMPSGFPLSF